MRNASACSLSNASSLTKLCNVQRALQAQFSAAACGGGSFPPGRRLAPPPAAAGQFGASVWLQPYGLLALGFTNRPVWSQIWLRSQLKKNSLYRTPSRLQDGWYLVYAEEGTLNTDSGAPASYSERGQPAPLPSVQPVPGGTLHPPPARRCAFKRRLHVFKSRPAACRLSRRSAASPDLFLSMPNVMLAGKPVAGAPEGEVEERQCAAACPQRPPATSSSGGENNNQSADCGNKGAGRVQPPPWSGRQVPQARASCRRVAPAVPILLPFHPTCSLTQPSGGGLRSKLDQLQQRGRHPGAPPLRPARPAQRAAGAGAPARWAPCRGRRAGSSLKCMQR